MTRLSNYLPLQLSCLALIFVTASCQGTSTNGSIEYPAVEDQSTGTSLPSEIRLPELPFQSRDFLVGTAGLFARDYPNSTEGDYREFLEEIPLTGELVGVYTDWAAPDLIESIQFVDRFAEGVDPLVALGFNIDQVNDDYFSRNLPEIKRVVRSVLEEFELDYLAFGVEVNRLIPEISQEAFLDFVNVYIQVYDLIK